MSSLAGFSPDGRYVVFQSNAANLTDDNPQRLYNLFLRDRMLGTTRRLTFPFSGGEFSSQPSFSSNLHITADNRHVQFAAGGSEFTEDSDPAVPLAVYEIDLQTGQIDLISRGVNAAPLNASAFGAAFSADGRYMAFETAATNVSEDPGALPGVFVRDRLTGETVNVSAALGTPPHTLPGQVALSADGSTVAFSWPRWNATFPTLLDNQQVYKVRLREDRPPLEAVALPAASRVGLVLLVLLLSMAALLSAKTTRWR
jgi:Tol biopolymer transport system component